MNDIINAIQIDGQNVIMYLLNYYFVISILTKISIFLMTAEKIFSMKQESNYSEVSQTNLSNLNILNI